MLNLKENKVIIAFSVIIIILIGGKIITTVFSEEQALESSNLKIGEKDFVSKGNDEKEIDIKLNKSIEVDDENIIIVPSEATQTIEAGAELLEQGRKSAEEAKKILTGLFNTELDIKEEDEEVILFISFSNISQEELNLNFNVGREFDFFVTNSEGTEVYNSFNSEGEYLPAITNYKLNEGEKLSFSGAWDYNDNYGNRVTSGKYSIAVRVLPMINYKSNFFVDELTAVRYIDIK